MTVTIIRCTQPDELYHRYPNRGAAQPVFIELDLRDGTLRADCDPDVEGNAVPIPVVHGLWRRYSIPILTGDAANRVMEEILPLAQAVHGDWEEVWNGENMVVRLGEDAQAADEEITARLGGQNFAPADLVAEWEVDGAVNGAEAAEYGITADTSDERLEEIAADIIAQLAACDDPSPDKNAPAPVVVVPGLEEYLRQLRQDARQDT